MLDFIFIWNQDGLADFREHEDYVRNKGAQLRIASTDHFDSWFSDDNRAGILTWGSDIYPFLARDQISRTAEELTLLTGWLVPASGARPVTRVSDLTLPAPGRMQPEFTGEYALVRAAASGEVRIQRDVMCSVQLYCYRQGHTFVVGTRASLTYFAATLNPKAPISADFVRSVLGQSVCMNDASLVAGVECIAQDCVISLAPTGRPVVWRRRHDPFRRDDLVASYEKSRDRYWDDVYEQLLDLVNVVDVTDSVIDIGLSGGRDSRLLLGLLLAAGKGDRLGTVFTNGPAFSPEVLSAKAVLDHFGLPHEVRMQAEGSVHALNIRNNFLRHAFITECEISPMDLFFETERFRLLQLHGQEAGLRNISGRREMPDKEATLKWFRVHLGRFDVCRILRPAAQQANEAEFLDYFGKQVLAVDDHRQLPTKHRIEHRYKRWVARTWGAYNASRFAPYIFATEPVVLATYNAGPLSRSLEEFHYEMLRRVDPVLVKLPFAHQTWDPDLSALASSDVPAVQPLAWPQGYTALQQRPTALSLQQHFRELIELIEEHASEAITGVIDMDALRSFNESEMKPGHVQPLWHLVTLLVADRAGDFANLNRAGPTLGALTLPDFDVVST